MRHVNHGFLVQVHLFIKQGLGGEYLGLWVLEIVGADAAKEGFGVHSV